MAGPVSILGEAITSIGKKTTRKAQGVVSELSKKGVKAEEFKWADLAFPTEGTEKVTGEDLHKALGERKDQFDFETLDRPGWSNITLAGGKDNPTYREDVVRFQQKGEAQAYEIPAYSGQGGFQGGERGAYPASKTRYKSTHFPNTPDYLMHSRSWNETMNGKQTKVVAEIQSDLHQEARQFGYAEDAMPELPQEAKEHITDLLRRRDAEVDRVGSRPPLTESDEDELEALLLQVDADFGRVTGDVNAARPASYTELEDRARDLGWRPRQGDAREYIEEYLEGSGGVATRLDDDLLDEVAAEAVHRGYDGETMDMEPEDFLRAIIEGNQRLDPQEQEYLTDLARQYDALDHDLPNELLEEIEQAAGERGWDLEGPARDFIRDYPGAGEAEQAYLDRLGRRYDAANVSPVPVELQEEITQAALQRGWDPDSELDAMGFLGDQLAGGIKATMPRPPKSPWQDTWLKKGIEQQISKALDEGLEQIAIPIDGQVKGLVRGEGVQEWYNTTVASTAKKVAKSSNADFEIQEILPDGFKPRIQPENIAKVIPQAHTLEQYSQLQFLDRAYGPTHPLRDHLLRAIQSKDAEWLENLSNAALGKFKLPATYKYWYKRSEEARAEYTKRNEVIDEEMKNQTMAERMSPEFHAKLKYADAPMEEYQKAFYENFGGRYLGEKNPHHIEGLRGLLTGGDDPAARAKQFKKVVQENSGYRSPGVRYAVIKPRGSVDFSNPLTSDATKLTPQQMAEEYGVSNKHAVALREAFSKDTVTDLYETNPNLAELVEIYEANPKPVAQAVTMNIKDWTEKYPESPGVYSGLRQLEKGTLEPGSTVAKKVQEFLSKHEPKFVADKTPKYALYSSPAAAAWVSYEAYQAGMTPAQVHAHLREQGFDSADIDNHDARVQIITQAKEAGQTDEQIKAGMEQMEGVAAEESSEPTQINFVEHMKENPPQAPRGKAFQRMLEGSMDMPMEEFVSSMTVVYPTLVSDVYTSLPALAGRQEADQRYKAARESSRARIVEEFKTKYGEASGSELVWQGEGVGSEGWYLQDPDGNLMEVTPSIWRDLKNNAGEIGAGVTLGIAGSIYGAKKGASRGAPGMVIGGLVGGAIGGISGAVVGAEGDYLWQAMEMEQDVNMTTAAFKALNATEAAVIGEIIGYGVGKYAVGPLWRVAVKAKEHVWSSQAEKAYRALKESAHLTDDEANRILEVFERHVVVPGKNRTEQLIYAISQSEPGLQDLTRVANIEAPGTSSVVMKNVTRRAEDVLQLTAGLTDEQVPKMLKEDLRNYLSDVHKQYSDVKAKALNSPRSDNFEWDMEEIAIQPILDDLYTRIVNPAMKERFLNQMGRINKLTESRNLGDLIELRQLTNEFLYGKGMANMKDKESLRGVLTRIDLAIAEGAAATIDNPKQWLQDWADARSSYGNMKQVEKTAIYRSMFKQDGTMRDINPAQVVDVLTKNITALDGSFDEVMSMLPLSGRKMYEGAILDSLVNKYTAGIEKGHKAIQFPMLADELRKVRFTTPDERATKQALIEMSEAFKNDVWLAQTAGTITIPKMQSFLTTDAAMRAKYEFASSIFNWTRSRLPGASNRQIALVRVAAKLLNNPLDAKSLKTLQEAVYDDANLTGQLLELKRTAAADRMNQVDLGSPSVRIYTNTGKFQGSGPTVSLRMHRIATLRQVQAIADSEGVAVTSKVMDDILIRYGYKAVWSGSDRTRILKGQ